MSLKASERNSLAILFALILHQVYCIKYELIITHIEKTLVNAKYVEGCDFFMSRSARNKPYTVTLNFTYVDVDYPNQSSICVEAWEKWSNVYKRSMTMYNETMCNWIKNDRVFYPMVKKHSNLPSICPLPKIITVSDVYLHTELLPSVIPWQAFQMIYTIYITKTGESVLVLVVSFDSKPLVKERKKTKG